MYIYQQLEYNTLVQYEQLRVTIKFNKYQRFLSITALHLQHSPG